MAVNFVEERFNTDIRYGLVGGPLWSTDIVGVVSGIESVNVNWSAPLGEWQLGQDLYNKAETEFLLNFFNARLGRAVGFRFKDWSDFKTQTLMPAGLIGTGYLQLFRRYSTATRYIDVPVLKPVAGTVTLYLNFVPYTGTYTVDTTTGLVDLHGVSNAGGIWGWKGEFDKPARFNTDKLDLDFVGYRDSDGESLFQISGLSIREIRLPTSTLIAVPQTVVQPAIAPAPGPAPAPAPSPGTPPPPPPPAPAPAPGVAPYKPFGTRPGTYATTMRPTDTQANMDAFIKQQYDWWIANLYKTAPSGLGSIPAGGAWVDVQSTGYATFSEAMGYGVLIVVAMAGYDGAAQSKFDALLKTIYAFPCDVYATQTSSTTTHVTDFMAWRISDTGLDAAGAYPALDGDLDIALGLLMAHAQWGSGGTYDYHTLALNRINAIKTYEIDPATYAIWASNTWNAGRTSDYMFNHFAAFKAATGDTFWDNVIAKQKSIVNYIQTNYSSSTGLIPDWCDGVRTSTPYPAPNDVSDGGNPHENAYWYNAFRDPWRMGTHYAMTGDADMATYCQRMENFFISSTGLTVTNLINGYALDGSGLVAPNPYWLADELYTSIMTGCMVNSSNQAWMDNLWAYTKAHPAHHYYGTEIQFLNALVVTGNWWMP